MEGSNRKVNRKEIEPEEWEEIPNRKTWREMQGFNKPSTGRMGVVYWTCRYEGHRAVECPTSVDYPGLRRDELHLVWSSRM